MKKSPNAIQTAAQSKAEGKHRRGSGGKRRVFLNLILFLAASAVGLALAEWIAKGFLPTKPPPEKTENIFKVEPTENPNRVYRIVPNSRFVTFGAPYDTNEFGFRDTVVSDRRKVGFRVYCIGDSVTFGTGVSNEETFPNLIEYDLQEKAPEGVTIDVINGGVSAYNARNIRALLTDTIEDILPDAVVYIFVENDLDDSLSPGEDGFLVKRDPSKPDRDPFIYREFPTTWMFLRNRQLQTESAILRILRERVTRVDDDALPLLFGDHPQPKKRWEAFRSDLEKMNKLCEKVGAKFFVYSFAARNHSEPAVRKVKQLCDQMDVPHCSTLPLFEKSTYMKKHSLGFDAHCNPEGHRLMADRLIRFLENAAVFPDELEVAGESVQRYVEVLDDRVADHLLEKSLEAPDKIDIARAKGIRGLLGGVDPQGRMAGRCVFRLGGSGKAFRVAAEGLPGLSNQPQSLGAVIEGVTSEEKHRVATRLSEYVFPVPGALGDDRIEVELFVEGPVLLPSAEQRKYGMEAQSLILHRVERISGG